MSPKKRRKSTLDGAMRPSFQKCWYKSVSKYKGLEVELLKWPRTDKRIAAELQFIPKSRDHAGVRANLTFFSWELGVQFYDSRHADEMSPKSPGRAKKRTG